MAWICKKALLPRRVASDTSGATAVEFALILPILVTLVLGIIQFGVILSVQGAMQAAAKSGVRTYAMLKEDGGGGGNGGGGPPGGGPPGGGPPGGGPPGGGPPGGGPPGGGPPGGGPPGGAENGQNGTSGNGCDSKDDPAEAGACKAVKDSLGVWWELFFAGNDPVSSSCKCIDKDSDVEVWSTEITISLATVSVVDFIGLFKDDEDNNMTARATWPVKNTANCKPPPDGNGCP